MSMTIMKALNVSLFFYFLMLVYMTLSLVDVKAFVPLLYKCKWNHQKKAVVGLITARHMAHRLMSKQNMPFGKSNKNDKFLRSLARIKKLSNETLDILLREQFDEDDLLQYDKNALETKLNVTSSDTFKLSAWIEKTKEKNTILREKRKLKEAEAHEKRMRKWTEAHEKRMRKWTEAHEMKRRKWTEAHEMKMLKEAEAHDKRMRKLADAYEMKKRKAAELLKKKKEKEAESKKMRERERKRKEAMAQMKTIQIFRPNRQYLSPMTFSNENEYKQYIADRLAEGAIELKNGKVPDKPVICAYKDLKSHEIYYFPYHYNIPYNLQEILDNVIRSSCDYASKQHLSNIFNCDFKFAVNDIVLKPSKGKRLGDVDSLFVSTDDSIFVLVERKRIVRTRGAARLFKKISDTAIAFKECLADTGFCNNLQISPKASPTIYSMLYIEAGDYAVVEEALKEGMFVLTSNLELRCPPSFTPPIK